MTATIAAGHLQIAYANALAAEKAAWLTIGQVGFGHPHAHERAGGPAAADDTPTNVNRDRWTSPTFFRLTGESPFACAR